MAPGADSRLRVEIAYARPDEQVLLELDVAPGTTVEQAIRLSGVLTRFPEIDLKRQKVGIFGSVVERGRLLRAGDRVEIYRPLIVDPKEARVRRARRKS
jgi:uncharacterized protein